MKSDIDALKRAVAAFSASVRVPAAKFGTGGRFSGHTEKKTLVAARQMTGYKTRRMIEGGMPSLTVSV
jgi:hypothetical protein